MKTYHHVRLQARKVQNYLFKFPKWRFIVGANSRLGELFAYDLPELRRKIDHFSCAIDFKTPCSDDFPFDNPQDNMKTGTLCSAGGHYERIFEKEEDALCFCREAAKLIKQELPGIQFGMAIKEFDDEITYYDFNNIPFQYVDVSDIHEPFFGLPHIQVSPHDGMNPVEFGIVESGINESELIYRMNEQKKKFFKYESKDFLCEFLKATKIPFWPSNNFDFDTENLSCLSTTRNKNQIAMIVMDGNRMGDRFRGKMEEIKGKNVLEAFNESELFWLNSRNKIRTAMKTVLKKIAEGRGGDSAFPVWPIFLGGDDVMLLTVPELALDLVVSFIEELKKLDPNHTVSAGIAVVKDSYPLVQAHELAESCLSSAKKEAYRTKESAVDWHILYDSRTTDIEEIRRRDYMLSYQADKKDCVDVLSCRPCTIKIAKELLKNATKMLNNVAGEERGMNKYKALRTILRQGKPMAEYQMKQLGITDGPLQFKTIPVSNKEIHLSRALDIIELGELYRIALKEGE